MNGIATTTARTNFRKFRAAARAAARATGVKVDVWRMGDRMYAEVASRLLPEDVREVEAAFWAAYNGH